MGATERVVQFIEYKGISKYKFCKDLGFSNKFLDNSSNMGTDKACKILHYFPEINPEWLLTGKGEMLKTHKHYTTEQSALSTVAEPNDGGYNKYISALEDKIKLLEENNLLHQEIKRLQERISRLELENTSIKSKPQDRAAG
ncbi:transcriptional regulator [Riemerella anatipestifer]|uniref:transcriptional regulator n=1 Tax=Riemerella anatipestifer TaxID=34085 RepID=UPI00129EED09|nr:transcriptional regulator [Riemerella anatipestifer]MRM85717.1 transcriptional regulator [Riemerella anatipestifer]